MELNQVFLGDCLQVKTMNFTDSFQKYSFPLWGFIKIPKIKIESDEFVRLGLKKDCSSEEYLYALVLYGFNQKLENGQISRHKYVEYFDRLELEYKEITRLLFTDYILLVYKIIQFCKSNDILNGPGRGSCGGSLLLYVLDCIKMDPIKYKLLFERFISASRTEVKEINGEKYISSGSLADVDIDCNGLFKEKVTGYIESEYPKRTAAIKTLSVLQGKVVIKEALKCLEETSEDEAKYVSSLIEAHFGKVEEISSALKKNVKFGEWAKNHVKTVEIAQKLNGLIKNASVHASGILLCEQSIIECLPLELSNDNRLVTAFSMDDSQVFGIKIDILGLKNLTAIQDCLKVLNKQLEDIDVDHPSIYEFINTREQFYGVFQAEEGLGKAVMRKLKCKNLEDIFLSIALGRPGSFKFVDEVVRAKESGKLREIDGRIKHILEPTYNVIVYQENIMSLCRVMANFTPLETNDVRKAVGKKLKDKMKKYEEKFVNQSIQNGFEKSVVEDIWQTFEDSGDYLFNASHSAGYGTLSAITIYLKANHPQEFFWALLKNAKNEQKPLEEIQAIVGELSSFDIKMLPPHILKSDLDFAMEGKNIRMGLGNVKNISEKNIAKLNQFRQDYPNKFTIFMAANEAKIPINILSSLILCGSMDEQITETRNKTFLEALLWGLLTPREKKYALKLGPENKFKLLNIISILKLSNDEDGKPIFKPSRLVTLRKHFAPYKEIHDNNKMVNEMSDYYHEKKLLGFSYSQKLINLYQKECKGSLTSINEVRTSLVDEGCHFVGEVLLCKTWSSKEKHTPCLKIIVKDETGEIDCLAFDMPRRMTISIIKECNGRLPKEEEIVVIKGKRGRDCVFIDWLGVQEIGVFDKLSLLKDFKKRKVVKKENEADLFPKKS